MRYLALSLLITLAGGFKVNPQTGPFEKAGSSWNVPNQLGIVTPPADIDFKIIVIAPPENLDKGSRRQKCWNQKRLGCAPPPFSPRKDDESRELLTSSQIRKAP